MQNYTADADLASIKLLAVDMDKTLLADDGSQPEDMPRLLDELADAGVVFCAASGRPGATLALMFAGHERTIALCADNGGDVAYQGKPVFRDLIAPAAYRPALLDAASRGDCAPIICCFDAAYVLERDRRYADEFGVYYKNITYVDSFENADYESDKFSLLFPDFLAEEAFAAYYGARYAEDFFVTNAGKDWIDFMNLGVNKGSGIAHLCEHLGIGMADVAAVGDTYNDIPMLEAAGHSFVVANAEKHMHAHARYLLPSNNDRGVAALIRAILAAKA